MTSDYQLKLNDQKLILVSISISTHLSSSDLLVNEREIYHLSLQFEIKTSRLKPTWPNLFLFPNWR